MATINRMRQRDVTRQATAEVRLYQTVPDRLAWRLGQLVIRLALWLLGFAGLEVQVTMEQAKGARDA